MSRPDPFAKYGGRSLEPAPPETAVDPFAKYGGRSLAPTPPGRGATGSWDEPPTVLGGLSNIASSTGRLVSGVAGMVAHPLDTLSGINELGWGAAEKAVPGVRERVTGQPAPETNPVDLVMKGLKERYGSMDAISRTAYNDPAGMF